MKDIEEKEKLLEQMETDFKSEALEEIRLEEIRLSEENTAKVDTRKKELEAMLAQMQKMESEFDELDAGFDTQISNMLSPDLALLEGANTEAKPAAAP